MFPIGRYLHTEINNYLGISIRPIRQFNYPKFLLVEYGEFIGSCAESIEAGEISAVFY